MRVAMHARRGPSRPRHPALTIVRFLAGLAVLVALNYAGGWLAQVTRAPVPGSVVGMLLLTALLEMRWIRESLVAPAADFLVRHLALLYVPAGVALMAYAGVVRHDLLAISLAALASLAAVLAVIGLLVQRLARDA